MRERHVIWDILVVGLLFVSVLINAVLLMQQNHVEKLLLNGNERLNQVQASVATLERAAADAPVASSSRPQHEQSGTHSERKTEEPAGTHSASYYDESMLPQFVRGDEKATDGDTMVINEISEPNSLNPEIDNDATAKDIFDRACEGLVDRSFDDVKYWEPKLARAWEKAMICRGIATGKNARQLAEKLNSQLTAEQRKQLLISKVEAESDEVLRIELSDATGTYREPVLKILGAGAIDRQHWFYVSFAGTAFTDGTAIDAASVAKRLHEALSASGNFKGRVLPDWLRGGSVVIQVVGSGDEAEKALKDYIASPANKGTVVDPKSATGKSEKAVLTFDTTEKYDFEEKPVFTFYLRKGVRYHDGHPFTGKDVVFSFDTMMNPKVECAPLRNYFQDCEKVSLVDDDPFVVRFVWRKPYFLSFSFSCGMYIFPEHVFHYDDAAEFNKTPKNQWLMGTGPYKLESWDRKQQLVYVRNDDYWGHKAHFKHVVCKFVDDPTVAFQMLNNGNLDLHGMTKAQTKLVINDPKFNAKFKIDISESDFFSYVGWNLRRDMFKSTKTRQALTMLVDRKRIADVILRGYAVPLDVPTHPESPNFPKDYAKFPFDMQRAKALLAEDGWQLNATDNLLYKNIDGKPTAFKFTLLIVSGSPDTESMANQMKDSFAQAGIVVNISNLEWSVFLQNINRLNFDAAVSGWQVDIDDDPYQLWHSSQTGEKASNHVGYVNYDVDRLIESGRRELDEAKRTEMFRAVYKQISEDQPYTCLFVPKRTVAYDKRVQNVVYKFSPPKDIMRWWVPTELQKVK